MLRELATNLRDAGFPNIHDMQHREGRDYLRPDGNVAVYSLGQLAPPGDWFIPTLSELIEACGHGSLDFDYTSENEFCAQRGTLRAFGASPAEAVARLWLTVNKKA
jgi:hypothetical protein